MKLQARKLQSNGRGYHVNVPPLWVRNAEMGKGSRIECETDEEGNLILKPMKRAAR